MTRIAALLTTTALGVGLALTQAHAQTATQAAANPAANAPDQQPATEGQTRAPAPAEFANVEVTPMAEDLPGLWGMDLLPDGRILVTTKEGAMHVISAEGEAGPELSGVPEVDSSGQGGLLDVVLANDFETSNRIFFSFSEPRGDAGNGTSVGRATLTDSGLQDVQVIFQQMPSYDGNKHYGSRIVPTADGNLFVTVGERSDTPIRDQSQDLASGLGKVFHITADGEPAEGNPFASQDGAQPHIWSYGHRNLQSAALDAQGRLWTVEHGPKGGDELNRPEAGKNYGWPVITYGMDYSGGPIGEGLTAQDGMEQPVYYWDPVIGPSGMVFYQGAEFPAWEGAALVGGLTTRDLVILRMDGDRVASEERLPLEARIRDVDVGSQGEIYAMTESRGGGSAILRLTASD